MRKMQFGAGTAIGLLVAVAAALGGGVTAAAADPTPAVIHELAVFVGDHHPPVGTFTASGIPGCASGSFSDHLVWFNTGARLVVDRTYVCDGGDTLAARIALHLGTVDTAGLQTADGTWRIIGSSAALAGSGSVSSLNSGCAPVGTALAECASGVGTITASVRTGG